MEFRTAKPIASFFILGMLLSSGGISGCSESSPPPTVEVSPSPVVSSPVAPPPAATPRAVTVADPFVAAEDAAQGAIALTQSAVSAEDWKLIAQQWERAIALLESVPKTDPKSTVAREKLAGYRENFAHARQQSQQGTPEPQSDVKPPPSGIIAVTGPNSAQKGGKAAAPQDEPKLALAQHLTEMGAKLYIKADCQECQYQRNYFSTAASSIAEVTCDPKAKDSDTDPCKKAGISTFPTWEVKGKFYPGVRSLDELAQLSGYKGDRNFNP
ncbi:hypothetical protein [Oscillatoria sp. FACHB-1406]|uniref:hypothetical protein n=1 Tax=Oscillatoria sp. FACHB-1406 TaxID=2692846 RepID=UPI00168557CA|nr:hypothetical protein [Oscillatoria sp. FACHB-1406]MBD2576304.1 hypothetical protein [Oscillatoria sp. FACHB-1406]